jgi:1-pyrroline-5-carboxylate dehydrogenase
MANAFFKVPAPKNEPILAYASGSKERELLDATIKEMKSTSVDIPMTIGGEKIFTDKKISIHPPHELKHTLGHYSQGDKTHVAKAIDAALEAKQGWEDMAWHDRAAIFLKVADLISGPYRQKIAAATMLGQGKNIFQAEIDSVAELADFMRFNVQYMTQLYNEQPDSSDLIWNRMEHRPLEGFIFALTPFNFTAIAANLCAAPAMLGNVIVWKPSDDQIYSAGLLMEIFERAGLPKGVINLVFTDGPEAGEVIFKHKDLAGLHFTGSTGVFKTLWRTIGENIDIYRSYPRIVGETGGKDFVVAHKSADAQEVATALVRGSFEFSGQKCSAASRAYIPASMWDTVRTSMEKDLAEIKTGTPEDYTNYVNAVINERSFDKIAAYIEQAKSDSNAEVIMGGTYSKAEGYFVEPTVILAKDADYRTMCEEIFGPVLTVHVYEDEQYEEMLKVVDNTSPYALTGSIFAIEREAINVAVKALRHSAGNFYINDKPTGAVVGQQPFGGGRGSGTNDKAGSILNLLRWVSPRTIKETFVPATNYTYPSFEK